MDETGDYMVSENSLQHKNKHHTFLSHMRKLENEKWGKGHEAERIALKT